MPHVETTAAPAAAPLTEAQVIANLDATLAEMSAPPNPAAPARSGGAAAKPAREPDAPASEHEEPSPDEETDPLAAEAGESAAGAEGEEPADPTTTDPAEPEAKEPRSENALLREELAEMRGRLEMLLAQGGRAGKDAPTTDSTGGAAAPSGGSDTEADEFADIKAALAAASGTEKEPGEFREVVAALGLDKLVAKLEAKEKARTLADKTAKQAEAQKQQQHAERQTMAIDDTLTRIASTHPDLAPIIGTTRIGSHTQKHLEIRQSILIEARHQMQRSQHRVKLGFASKPMTDVQALTAAVRAITGKEVQTFTQGSGKDTEAAPSAAQTAQARRDAAARTRARQVRPESGGGGERSNAKTEKQVEQESIAAIDAFLKGS